MSPSVVGYATECVISLRMLNENTMMRKSEIRKYNKTKCENAKARQIKSESMTQKICHFFHIVAAKSRLYDKIEYTRQSESISHHDKHYFMLI